MDEERDQLWQLLGRAKQPAVSPFFARNVLRAVRAEQDRPRGWQLFSVHWRRIAFAASTCAAILLAVNAPIGERESGSQPNPLTPEIASNPDYEIINNLDELLAYEETSIWLENSTN